MGCGAGLVGVALHRAGAGTAVLADGDAGAVANAARNATLNGAAPVLAARGLREAASSGAAAACCQLLWGADEEDWGGGGEGETGGCGCGGGGWLPAFDAVLASDVVYDPSQVPALVGLLKRLLCAGGAASAAHVATTRRNPATLELFEAAAAEAGLALEHLPTGPWRVAFRGAHALRDRGAVVLHRITLGGGGK